MTRPRSNEKSGDGTMIKLAVMAVGGQGGGVLTNWITDLAQRNGYVAQATSVAGVAQRTGATIYYVEMAPDTGTPPVFALSPSPGDVDILIASELMEAGRAVLRGFVTPDRTTLIASQHRVLAVSEKEQPGDGRADDDVAISAAKAAALRLICFDMEKVAMSAGSVISASLFGALAGSDVLPFPKLSFEETIRASGRGVEASLRAFEECVKSASAGEQTEDDVVEAVQVPVPQGPKPDLQDWQALGARIDAMPEQVRPMALAGLAHVVDFQNTGYGDAYLDRLDRAVAGDGAEHDYSFSVAAAKYLARAMVYDDVIRVADLKIRKSRFVRLRKEQNIDPGGIVHITEYFHPRAEEIIGTLPAAIGRWIENKPALQAWLDKRANKGRRIRSDGVMGFSSLWFVASLRPFRSRFLRHEREVAHLETWFDLALDCRGKSYALGTEILNCRRLIKGYSDTHARGLTKYGQVVGSLALLEGREDAADWVRRLRQAALADPDGTALEGALKTIAS